MYDLDIPLINGRVPFHKTAFELVKRVSQSKIPEGANSQSRVGKIRAIIIVVINSLF